MSRGRLVPLVMVAAERGEVAMEAVERALANDGELRGREVRPVLAMLHDWRAATRLAKAGKRLANAAECGVGLGDRTYFQGLVDQYGVALDELPETAA